MLDGTPPKFAAAAHSRREATASTRASSDIHSISWGLVAAALTGAAAFLGLRLQGDGIALFWPASGVFAGVLAVAPARARWAVILGALLALATANVAHGRTLAASIFFIAGDLAEAVLLAWTLSRFTAPTSRLQSMRAVGVFVAIAMIVPAVVAPVASLGLHWSGHASGGLFNISWLWTSSHTVGVLVTTPAIMLLRRPLTRIAPFWLEHVAVALYISATALVAAMLHAALDPNASLLLGLALLGPFAWWICQRASLERAAIAALSVAVSLIWSASATTPLHASPLEAQMSLAAIAVLLLAFGAWQNAPPRDLPGKAPDELGQKPRSGAAAILSARPHVSHLALFYSVYLLGAGLTQALATLPGTWISIWLPNGFLLAPFLMKPKASWPWWILAAFLGELTGNALWYGNSLPIALMFCIGNTLEVAAAAWLITRFCPDGGRSGTLRDTIYLIVLGAGVAPAIGASLNAATALLEGRQTSFADAWMRLWTGDATGILIGAPLALAVLNGWTGQLNVSRARLIEAIVVAAIFAGFVVIALNGQTPLAYAVTPALLWTAVRFGRAGAATAAAFLAVTTAAFTVVGISPFATASETPLNEELQIFLTVSALSALLVAGVARDRQSALEHLRHVNETLERRVEERTASLAVSEQRYRTMIDANSAVTWSSLPSGLILEPQPHWMAFTGQSADEILGAGWMRAVHPEDAGDAAARWADALTQGKPYSNEQRIRRFDGVWRWMRVHIVPIRQDGRIIEWFGMCVDITESKAAEEATARLAAIVNSSSDAIISKTTCGIITSWNAGAMRLYGYSPDDVIGKSIHLLVPPDRQAEEESFLARIAAGELIENYETVRLHRNGAPIDMSITISPIHDVTGRVVGASTIARDIREQKRTKEALRAAHETFRQLVDRSRFGIYAIDADFRVAQVSNGAQKVFENVRPLIGRDFAEVMRNLWSEPFASKAISRFRHTLMTGEAFHEPGTVERRADINATEAYDWKIERIVMPDERFGVVCHFYDLSERQRHEEHIHLLMREVSHRSKNMLALVGAMARQTVTKSPEDFVEHFGKRIQALAAGHDLLVKSDWKSVPLGDLVRSQLAHFGSDRDARVSLDGPLVEITAGAAQTLGMALHELSTNAAKYGALSSEDGRVAIRWDVRPDETGDPQFTMSWVESGGPPVTAPSRRGFGSTVIGDMVKSNFGGAVTLEYAPTGVVWGLACSAASVVEGSAPAASPILETNASSAPPLPAGRRVLVVEDEALIAMDIADTLSEAGFKVIGPAGTVAQALRLIAEVGCDAAVLDINLGAETSEPIAQELTRTATPFIALSGYAPEQQPAIMRNAPLLGKLLMTATLLAAMEDLLARAQA